MVISWENQESYLLLNSKYSNKEQARFQEIIHAAGKWPGHIWLSTSGSSTSKWVGLSKEAFLASAAAVNKHLDSQKEDCWINTLPHFHVGGLGIWARAYLNGSQVFDFKQAYPGKWRAEEFFNYIQRMKGTLTSLVPAQLYDLIQLGWKAPSCLKAIIIGGGALLPLIYEKAVALGWPILPSYGLTECASGVATASLEGWRKNRLPHLQLLTHLEGDVRDGRLSFKGPSLLSTYAYLDGSEVKFIDPKIDGWLITEDRGTINGGIVNIFGRTDAITKIGGENVDLAVLENHLQTLRLGLNLAEEATLLSLPDSRLGNSIQLASNSPNKELLEPLIHEFQTSVLPFERIRKIYLLNELPRSSLGKILQKELIVLLSTVKPIDI